MFITYAQNFEDVMLWRALKDVAAGFYIDVGAWAPVDDSVTLAFYERGWRGINIEPNPDYHQQLQDARPRDVNLALALADHAGQQVFHRLSNPGWSTLVDTIAAEHRAAGLAQQDDTVEVSTLSAVWQQYVPAEQPVHFVKIDVEGAEAAVLRGHDWQRYRPWIVLIEATVPGTQTPNHHDWEPLLLEAAYVYAYSDGINRFYVAQEHAEALLPALAHPPNFFDQFVPVSQVRANQWAEQANERAAEQYRRAETAAERAWQAEQQVAEFKHQAWQAEQRLAEAEQQVAEFKHQAWQAEQQLAEAIQEQAVLRSDLHGVINSRSWRLTAPLRQAMAVVRRGRQWWRARAAHQLVAPSGVMLAAPGFNPVVWPTVPRPLNPSVRPAHDPTLRIRLIGHVEGHYSLAIVNRGLALALEAVLPSQLQWRPWHGGPSTAISAVPAAQAEAIQRLVATSWSSAEAAQCVSISHHYPLLKDPEPARWRLVIFFWEETSVPAATVAQINAQFDAVLVASRAVQRALRDSGCRLPIRIMPLGVEHLISPTDTPLAALHPAAGQRLRFLHISSAFPRKGVDVLFAAFFQAFTAADEVELYIKTFPNPHHDIHAQLAGYRAQYANPPAVIIDQTELDDAGLLALYHSAQAVVLPTRGEGFNLPAAEALALGIPVIVTGASAQVDFCTLSTAYLIPYQFAWSASHLRAPDACWLEPDVAGLVAVLKQAHQDVLEDAPPLQRRREQGRAWIRQHYSWAQAAATVQQLIQDLPTATVQSESPQRVAVISPWATRCGIAEYSRNQLGAFLADTPGTRLQVYCDRRTEADPSQSLYQPTWVIGDAETMRATLDTLSAEGCEVLLIQHQPSLFALDPEFCERCLALQQQGVRVLLELHSTAPLVDQEGYCLEPAAVVALRGLDRIIVHSPRDRNHLLALGLVDNVMLLPLAVMAEPVDPATTPDLALDPPGKVIASFGFLLPHKGIDVLIRALAPLAEQLQQPVYLLAVNAVMDERSAALLTEYQALAAELGVAERIIWHTKYLPVAECVRLLSAADCSVYPYSATQESVSGAVTVGLAALRPVLVSPQPIFADLADCTAPLAGTEVADIVAGVRHWLTADTAATALLERQRAWLDAHSQQRLSQRLYDLCAGLRHDRAQPESAASRQWLVDCSELYFRDAGTGIQRVVHHLLREWRHSPPPGYTVYPVYATAGQPYRYAAKLAPECPILAALDQQPITWARGDQFIGLDLTAHLFPEIEPTLASMRRAGVGIHYVIYDILPLTHPAYFQPELAASFAPWLQGLARCADRLLCISAHTAAEVAAYLPPDHRPQISHFPLATELGAVLPEALPAEAEALLSQLAQTTVVLMVGTVEPRKGHAQALAAFEQLWAAEESLSLVIVGKQGWMMDEWTQRLPQHPEYGRRLWWLQGVGDAYLQRLYGVAAGLLAASLVEGFGLPLIEAAEQGVPIVARDIAVFREVAGEAAVYFSGEQPEDLAQVLRQWNAQRIAGTLPDSRTLRRYRWADSAAAFTQQVLA